MKAAAHNNLLVRVLPSGMKKRRVERAEKWIADSSYG
jgi:hypothetical protein